MARKELPRQREDDSGHHPGRDSRNRRVFSHPGTERLPAVRHKGEPVSPGLRPVQPLPLQRQRGAGHRKLRPDRLWREILRLHPATMDNPGPAGGEILQHLAVRLLQQQSGEFCGFGWNGLDKVR